MSRQTPAGDTSPPGKKGPATLARTGEDSVIRYLRKRHGEGEGAALLGIGDDAALFTPRRGRKILFTTDLMAENVHFSLQSSSPEDLGFKLAAVNVSDIAAMGGRPTWALLSLSLPGTTGFDFIRRLSAGLRAAERKFGFRLLGGDTTASPSGIFASLALLGELDAAKPLTRSGAAPNDVLYVTGHLGASVLGFEALRRGGGLPRGRVPKAVTAKHLRPSPPLSWAAELAVNHLASAAIDLSDGLSTDLERLCNESGAGAEVETAQLPIRPSTRRAAAALGLDAENAALHGGEEYELLFTVRPRKVAAVEKLAAGRRGTTISRIGQMVPAPKMYVRSPRGNRQVLRPRGWHHFRS
jgi:thiamine-monophosphate kinase